MRNVVAYVIYAVTKVNVVCTLSIGVKRPRLIRENLSPK